jgi:flagellar biosynthesis protein FliQ
MTPESVVHLLREMMLATFWLSAPLLVLGFLVGILVSLVQIVTSMQDSAFNTVPRLAAFLVGLILFLPWMLMRLMSYATSLFADLGRYAR